jgi:hypothetical protein
MWTKIKWEALELLGYIFCEISLKWWGLFDNTPLMSPPTLWNKITYLIGVPSYNVGCFFYNLQEDIANVYKKEDHWDDNEIS